MLVYDSAIEYGNSRPVQGWMTIDADIDDWYELQNQECYRQLMEYLHRKGTPYIGFDHHRTVSTEGTTALPIAELRRPPFSLKAFLKSFRNR